MGAVNANKNAQPSNQSLKQGSSGENARLTVRPTSVVLKESKSILR
jgi:hypothetical protein